MIGNKIKQLRKSCGLTQAELGQKLGVIKQTVSNWENNVSTPSGETLSAIAKLFDVTTDYLLNNDVTSYIPQAEVCSNSEYTPVKHQIDLTGIGYEEIAIRLNIPVELLSDYIEGRKDIPYNELVSLSEICEVSTDCLLGLIENSRKRDFNNELPFKFNYEIAARIKHLCSEQNIDINSSYLEVLLSLSREEIFNLLEYGFVPHMDTIITLAKEFNVSTDYLLCQIGEHEEKLLNSFKMLNGDNKDIIIGEIKKCLKEQRYEKFVSTDKELRQAK